MATNRKIMKDRLAGQHGTAYAEILCALTSMNHLADRRTPADGKSFRDKAAGMRIALEIIVQDQQNVSESVAARSIQADADLYQAAIIADEEERQMWA